MYGLVLGLLVDMIIKMSHRIWTQYEEFSLEMFMFPCFDWNLWSYTHRLT